VHDLFGLVSPEVAAIDSSFDASAQSPGHDARVELEFFLDREPDVLEARLIEGLPGLAKSGEAAARERFATQFEKQWIRKLENDGLADDYVAEFRPLEDPEASHAAGLDTACLAWWQRVARDEAEEARARVRRRLRAWREGAPAPSGVTPPGGPGSERKDS